MQKQQERVFAYTLAKSITVKELQTIAGGNGSSICYQPTFKPTGSTINSLHGSVYMVIDA